jgi:hypothetical protein
MKENGLTKKMNPNTNIFNTVVYSVDLKTVIFNPLEQPLKNVSIGNSEVKTNLTTKH